MENNRFIEQRPRPIPNIKEQNSPIKTAREKYFELVGIDHFPRSPEELPDNIFLPGAVLGNLEQAIFNSGIEDKEYSQEIYWDKKKKCYIYSRLVRGKECTVAYPRHLINRLFDAAAGRIPIIFYHTHPLDSFGSQRFSDRDIMLADKRLAYIELLGTKKGISALFPTDLSKKIADNRSITDAIKARIRSIPNFNLLNYTEQIKIIDNIGLAFYSTGEQQIKSGSLRNGIKLIRNAAI